MSVSSNLPKHSFRIHIYSLCEFFPICFIKHFTYISTLSWLLSPQLISQFIQHLAQSASTKSVVHGQQCFSKLTWLLSPNVFPHTFKHSRQGHTRIQFQWIAVVTWLWPPCSHLRALHVHFLSHSNTASYDISQFTLSLSPNLISQLTSSKNLTVFSTSHCPGLHVWCQIGKIIASKWVSELIWY